MPIYEYRCGGCGHEFEEWQKISEDPVRKCPKCRAKKVERLVSLTSFQLKGGGWYVTDYGGKKAEGSPSKASGSTDEGDSGSSKGKKAGKKEKKSGGKSTKNQAAA